MLPFLGVLLTQAAAPSPSDVLWLELAKIALAMVATGIVTWITATKREAKRNEKALDSAGVATAVDLVVRPIETRVSQLEVAVFGFGTHREGGVLRDLAALQRSAKTDHDLLVHVNGMVSELYRRITREEPPAVPTDG